MIPKVIMPELQAAEETPVNKKKVYEVMKHLNYKALMNSPMLDRWGIGLEALPGALKGQYGERRNQITADYLKKFHPNEIYNRITQEPVTASGGMHPGTEGAGVAAGVALSRTLNQHFGLGHSWGDSALYGAGMGAAVGLPIAAIRGVPYVKRQNVERKLNTFDPIQLEQARQLFARNPELSTPERQAQELKKESAFMDTTKFLNGFEQFIKEASLDTQAAYTVRYCLPMVNLGEVYEYAKMEKTALGIPSGLKRILGMGKTITQHPGLVPPKPIPVAGFSKAKALGYGVGVPAAVAGTAYGASKYENTVAATGKAGLEANRQPGSATPPAPPVDNPLAQTGGGAGAGEVTDPQAPNKAFWYAAALGIPLTALAGTAFLGNQDKEDE
jgi:hypothetical protein